mmetsp:Transcript_11663/g.28309  ORF Transcript_11663/g.28309 Transcript_11663/m.28309 type:complete len:203 (-) Transcript_11663:290-898(-)
MLLGQCSAMYKTDLVCLVFFCGKFDGSCELVGWSFDNPRHLGGDGLDGSSNLGIQFLLGRQLGNRIDTLGIIHLAFQDSSQNIVCFFLSALLQKGFHGFDGPGNIILDKEPHICALQQGIVSKACVWSLVDSTSHQFVLNNFDGGCFWHSQAKLFGFGNSQSTGRDAEDHFRSLQQTLDFFHGGSLAFFGCCNTLGSSVQGS